MYCCLHFHKAFLGIRGLKLHVEWDKILRRIYLTQEKEESLYISLKGVRLSRKSSHKETRLPIATKDGSTCSAGSR